MLAEQLLRAVSFEERFDILAAFVENLGYDGLCYTVIPRCLAEQNHCEDGPFTPFNFARSQGYPESFITYYQTHQQAQHDFTLRLGLAGHDQPMDWRHHEQHGQLTANERQLIAHARKHGINNAITIPTTVNQHILGGASVISHKTGQQWSSLLDDTLATLTKAIGHFHHAVHHPIIPDNALPYVWGGFKPHEKHILSNLLILIDLKRWGF